MGSGPDAVALFLEVRWTGQERGHAGKKMMPGYQPAFNSEFVIPHFAIPIPPSSFRPIDSFRLPFHN